MAQRHPRSNPHSSRTANPDEDDLFVAKTLEFSGWVRQNSQTLLLFGVVLAVLVAGTVYLVNQRSARAIAAATELEQVTQLIGTGGLDREAGKAELGRFVERFEGTAFAAEGRLILAQFHLEDGEADQALTVLEGAPSDLQDGLGFQSTFLRARALEQAGRLDEAQSLYVRIANDAPMTFQEVDALEDAARLSLAVGDVAQALDLYDRLIELAPEGSQPRAVYEMRRAEAASIGG